MRVPASYDEPFAWWGPIWTRPGARHVADLIRDGTIAAETAGLLWSLLARRASLVVVAEPSGAGKTTLLTALLDFLPPGTRRLFLRGCYEPFAFLDDPAMEPARTTLLVNEISAHLPAYLWGPGVRRALEATSRGFGLAATAHATSAAELVRSLAGYPLRVPVEAIAALGLVVHLDAWLAGDAVRREVASVTGLVATPGRGLTLLPFVARSGRGTRSVVDLRAAAMVAAPLGWTGDEAALRREVGERAAALAAMADAGSEGDHPALAELGRRWVSGPAIG
jgi:energy-coupling factor transporter ATP-binding protein EcfA2